jgi:DNA-binding XRE family transcriptional regulator
MKSKKKTSAAGGKSKIDKIDPRDVGSAIKHVRTKDLKLKQHELAAAIEVDPTTVSNWEGGSYAPSVETIIRIARLASPENAVILYQKAGVDLEKVRLASGSPFPSGGPYEGAVELDLLDADNALSGAKAKEVVPRSWLANWCQGLSVDEVTKKISLGFCAARVRSPITLFPFVSGDIALLDRSILPVSALLGRPVAVHFARYPERLTPSGTEGLFDLQAIQVGWLAIDRPNQPEFSINAPTSHGNTGQSSLEDSSLKEPWRLILRGASVQGVSAARWPGIPISEWQLDTKTHVEEFAYSADLPFHFLPHIQILGLVISWKRTAGYTDMVANVVTSRNR